MLLAEHYVFVTIVSLAFALPWVDHSLFFRASQNMALARGRGGHYPQRHGADPLLPIDKIVSTGVITVFLNWI